MSNAIVKKYNAQDLALIKKHLFPANVSDKDFEYCLTISQELNLNPFLKEVYFVPRKANVDGAWIEKVEPLISRDGLLSLAHKSGNFAGIETTSAIKEVPILKNGAWQVENDLIATCKVYVKGIEKPFIAEVAFKEYAQKDKQGNLTRFWAEKPDTMLKKVAESQALRKAFNVNGVYIPEEVGSEAHIEVIDSKIENVQKRDELELAKEFNDFLKNQGLEKDEIKAFCEANQIGRKYKGSLEKVLNNLENVKSLVDDFKAFVLNENVAEVVTENIQDEMPF